MEDEKEYGSIVALLPAHGDMVPEMRRALGELEAIRGRPCLMYIGNTVKPKPASAIEPADVLPFAEMVNSVPAEHRSIDVVLATDGGVVEVAARLVETLRLRFDEVNFIVPSHAMSAGTLLALSGNRIWMTDRAYLGPVDPQIRCRDGRLVPAQSVLSLLEKMQREGELLMAKGQQPNWTHVVILKSMDLKEVAAAHSATAYVTDLAAQFIERYKFNGWTTRETSGATVTPAERSARAQEIAAALCSHERWKAHGHAINRDVLEHDLRLRIDRPETVAGFARAIRRLWALCYYVFDRNEQLAKTMLSQNYSFFRMQMPGA